MTDDGNSSPVKSSQAVSVSEGQSHPTEDVETTETKIDTQNDQSDSEAPSDASDNGSAEGSSEEKLNATKRKRVRSTEDGPLLNATYEAEDRPTKRARSPLLGPRSQGAEDTSSAASIDTELSESDNISAAHTPASLSPTPAAPKAAVNPFLKTAASDATWDDIAEEEDEKPAPPKLIPATGGLRLAPGIQPSTTFGGGFTGSSLGTGSSWSSWSDAGKQAAPKMSVPAASVKPVGQHPVAHASSTPQKSNFGGGYVFGSSIGSGFGSVGKPPAAPFGTPINKTPAFAPASSTSAADEPASFANLLVTPQKNAFGKLSISPAVGTPVKTSGAGLASSVNTGEEHERHIFQKRGKLYEWDSSEAKYRGRGSGSITVNVDRVRPERGRILMRAEGTHRLMLNAKISDALQLVIRDDRYADFNATPIERPGTIAKYVILLDQAAFAVEFRESIEQVLADLKQAVPEVTTTPPDRITGGGKAAQDSP
ncbi:hypothetical protein HKX48_002237 [Thoreauomyces humboldtii]|nr:hypothetical protein HKX48_002237 [Thoreauomyces humboldtii]